MPNPGFESAGVPSEHSGGSLSRSTALAHSGAYGLAQVASSTKGDWDLDDDASWQAPIAAPATYRAEIWVSASKTASVTLNLDLLDRNHRYLKSVSSSSTKLTANVWTRVTVSFQAKSSQVYAAMAPSFSGTTKGTVLTWDDMNVTPG